MDNDEHRHAHPDPFVRHLSRNLIGHEKQKQDGHCRIHDSFDSIV
jgi:hypothetical protein